MWVWLAILSLVTFSRSQDWFSDRTLWASAVRVTPDRPRPHVNYGRALQLDGELDPALDQYWAAIVTAQNPRRIHGLNLYCRLSAETNAAIVLVSVNRYQEAWDLLNHVLSDRTWPEFPYALYSRGVILARAGECTAARLDQERAIRLDGTITGVTPCAGH